MNLLEGKSKNIKKKIFIKGIRTDDNMKKNESISILIPARNAEAYLAECLDSVCKQLKYEDEIIIINNDSNDKTGEIISLYENKYNITHVKLKEKVSLFESRKIAITKAKNDYIVFLDSDDLLENEALKTLREKIIKFNYPSILIYRTLYFNSNESKESENIFGAIESFELDEKQKNKLFTIFFNTDSINNIWLKCIKREDIIEEYKRYIKNTHFTYVEDKLHTLLIFNSCSQIVYMPDILYKYRKHETAASSKASLEWIIELINLCGIFQTFFETNMNFKRFQKSAFIFFKTQLSRLYVWYIGQNVLSLRTLRLDIEEINQLILAQNLPFQNIHSQSPLYDNVFNMVRKNHIVLLVPICKLYVKFIKDKKGKKI